MRKLLPSASLSFSIGLLLVTLLCAPSKSHAQENLKYRFFHSAGLTAFAETYTDLTYRRAPGSTEWYKENHFQPEVALGSLYYNLRINIIQYKPGVALSVGAVPTASLSFGDGILVGTPLVAQLELFGGSTYWAKHKMGIYFGYGREYVTSLFGNTQYTTPVFTTGVRIIGDTGSPIEIALKIGKFDLLRDTQAALQDIVPGSRTEVYVTNSFRLGLLFMLDY